MAKIKDNVKKELEIGEILIKQGDMYYNERTKCYYTVTFIKEVSFNGYKKALYNLYNINKANLYYNGSMGLKELDCMISNANFIAVKDSELIIEGKLY